MQRRTFSPSGKDHTRAVIIHSQRGDELPSEDLTAIVAALRVRCLVEVWLPQTERCVSAALAEQLRTSGIAVRFVPLPSLAHPALGSVGWAAHVLDVRRLKHFLRQEPCDLVYLTGRGSGALAPLLRATGHMRVILHLKGDLNGAGAREIQRLARSCDHLVVSTQRTRELLISQRWPTVTVVPDRVRSDEAVALTRRYIGVARWASGSGYLGLLRAWNAAGCPGVLELVGGDLVGDSTNALPTLVRALVADSSTVRVSYDRADLVHRLSAFDAVILPAELPDSLHAFAQAVVSRGVPCLVSRGIRMDESFEEGVSGWRFSAESTPELAALLRRLSTASLRNTSEASRIAADPLQAIVGAELGNVSRRKSATNRDYAHEPVREIALGRTRGARSPQM
ncbi:MAG TPA: hypothetical protein VGP24_00095 [Glaciihabitans sp.]|nr:hypothetical protein [Glaciihabitans sp.]